MTHTHIHTHALALLMALIMALPLGAATYTISSLAELEALATNIAANNGYEGDDIFLEADITIPSGTTWTAIGSATHPFKGHFDGKNHLISGLTQINGDGGYGFFGVIGANGHVENLGISEGSIVALGNYVGTFAGVCAGTIQNCWSMAQITLAGNTVGGFVGQLEATASLSDVYSVGPVLSMQSSTVGAFVGYNNGGAITRAYTNAYAKNGNGFVGQDNNGSYTECYFDRKLYMLEPGATTVTPVDTTSHMFTRLTDAHWAHTNNLYPQLETFKNTDASLLSVTPLFVDSTKEDHANKNLINDISFDTSNGITWACQKEEDTLYVKINGNKASIVRPCTDREVMLDAHLNGYIHTFYLLPKPVDDLKILPFSATATQESCFGDHFQQPSMPTILDGTPTYHYRITLDSLDATTQAIKKTTVLADDDDASYPTYALWQAIDTLPTNQTGLFALHFYAHDEGCFLDWKECPNTYKYIVYPKVILGEIADGTNRADTLFVNQTLSITGTPTTGGKAPIQYQWFINDSVWEDSTNLAITGHLLTDTGTFIFTRMSYDAHCYLNEDSVPDAGSDTVLVIYPFDPGAIEVNTDTLIFCSSDEAKAITLQDTLASGAMEEFGYLYQWYYAVGTDTTAINGATDHSLSLAIFNFVTGTTYTFFRKTRNNWWRCPFTQSRGQQTIRILAPYQAGSITNHTDTIYAGDTISIIGSAPTGGLEPYSYQWYSNNSPIADSTHQNMVNHVLTELGQYLFTRASADALCSPDLTLDEGTDTLLVIVPFDPGAVAKAETQVFCTVEDAQSYLIADTAASGAITENGYSYQWYQVIGTDTTILTSATNENLSLSDLTLEAGKTYTFFRMARNNWWKCPFTESRWNQTIQILADFVPGSITSAADTMAVDAITPISISATASTGGQAPITYQWYCNTTAIDGETNQDLSSYTLPSTAGTYTFTRWSADAQCHPSAEDEGTVTILIYNPFLPGAIAANSDTLTYCTLDEAKNITISSQTPASGGIEDKGYLYQWFQIVDAVTTEIAGATNEALSLSDLTLEAGKTYTFFRKARNNWYQLPTWENSANEQSIYILAAVNTGSVETKDYGVQCTDITTFDISIDEITPASGGEQTLAYQWQYTLDGGSPIDITGETSASLTYTLTLDETNAGKQYTFRRYVKQGTCEWLPSDGYATFRFGHEEHHTRSITICSDKMPYTLTRTRLDGTSDSHTFTADGEAWIFNTQNSAGCQSDTTFTLKVKPVPQVAIETTTALCQQDHQLSLPFDITSGDADYFRITYTSELAALLGRTDTADWITTPGSITIQSVPLLGNDEYTMLVSFADSESGDTPADYCYTDPQVVTFHAQLGGYVHSKFERILFVDNNPENGEQPAPKLSFNAYQWFKDGVQQEGQTGQYYHEDGALLNGTYYVLLTDTAGQTYRSCPVIMTPTSASGVAPTTVYPVPANVGEVITVVCNNADITVIATSGERVLTRTDVAIQTQFNAPTIPGFYLIQIAHKDGRIKTHKLIVK
ncbi:MAG: T9SS type A sorting domain-containing protein [Paludibacteraceae bacterium]|nr:T9SS type A sorting domain-containing protein [Paludibacteraceae bacterium]